MSCFRAKWKSSKLKASNALFISRICSSVPQSSVNLQLLAAKVEFVSSEGLVFGTRKTKSNINKKREREMCEEEMHNNHKLHPSL